nr:uncharacterized protein LOC127311812 isoform X2 [Lolium perenne]
MDYHNQGLSPLEDYNVYDNFAFTPEDDDPASSMDLHLGADGPVLARFGFPSLGEEDISPNHINRTADVAEIERHTVNALKHFLGGAIPVGLTPAPAIRIRTDGWTDTDPTFEPPPTPDFNNTEEDYTPGSALHKLGATVGEPYSEAVLVVLKCLHERSNGMEGVHIEELTNNLHVVSAFLRPYIYDLMFAGDKYQTFL